MVDVLYFFLARCRRSPALVMAARVLFGALVALGDAAFVIKIWLLKPTACSEHELKSEAYADYGDCTRGYGKVSDVRSAAGGVRHLAPRTPRSHQRTTLPSAHLGLPQHLAARVEDMACIPWRVILSNLTVTCRLGTNATAPQPWPSVQRATGDSLWRVTHRIYWKSQGEKVSKQWDGLPPP